MLFLNISAFYNLAVLFFLLCGFFYAVYAVIEKRKISPINRRFLAGKWLLRGMDPAGQPWQFVFRFTPTEFEMWGDPTYYARGSYVILKEVESMLILRLLPVAGDMEEEEKHLQVGINRRENRIMIDGREYERIKDDAEFPTQLPTGAPEINAHSAL